MLTEFCLLLPEEVITAQQTSPPQHQGMPISRTVRKQFKMHASIPFKHKHKSAKPDEIASATFSFK